MGAWDELDTLISVDVDTTDLDDLSNLDDPYGIIKDCVVEEAEKIKKAIDEGSQKGVKFLANFNRSQQQRILQGCKRPEGRLSSSINDEMVTPYSFLIGTSITEIYPLSIEFGRGPVYPKPPRTRLRFYGEDGYLIYPKMAGPAQARPYVAPAYEDTSEIAEDIMLIEIFKLV